jgi:hypothetical protein
VPCVGDMASDGCQPLVFNGQLTGYNKDNQNGKISFPAAATSYRQLRVGTGRSSTLQATVVPDSDVEFRTRALYGRNNKAHEKTQFNSEGIPIGVANVTGSQYAKPSGSVRRPAAMMQPASIPLTLCASWPLRGSDKHIPSVGWRCSAEDAGCAVEAKCAMLDAHGDELSESSLGAALSAAEGARSASFVVSSIGPLDGVTDVGAAVAQCVERLGGAPDLLFLSLGDAVHWSAAASAVIEAAPGMALGLRCESPASAVEQLNQILAAPGPRPSALQLDLNPTSPKVQRMLVGLCKRQSLKILATCPLGGLGSDGVLAACATAVPGLKPGALAPMLLAWSVGRGVCALASAAEGEGEGEGEGVSFLITPADAHCRRLLPLSASHRSSLDGMATQDGLRAVALTGSPSACLPMPSS